MANSFDRLISRSGDNTNSKSIAVFSLENIPSSQNDCIANSTEQLSRSVRKLSVIAPESLINSMVASSSPPFSSAPDIPSTAVEFPLAMNTTAFPPSTPSNSANQEFKLSAAASTFTPSSQSRDRGLMHASYAPATLELTNGQEVLPMPSFQDGSSRNRRPPSYFQTREYHEGSLRDKSTTRAGSSPPLVSSSLFQPQYSSPASNQNHVPPSFEIQTFLPHEQAGFHANLLKPQPPLPALTQDGVLSQAYSIQSSSSQTQLQVHKFTCRNCKWPSTFDDVECVLPLPSRPKPSQAWLHRRSSRLSYSYLGHFQSDLTERNNENTEIDSRESFLLLASQDDLISTDVREEINFVTQTNVITENILDGAIARGELQHESSTAPTSTPVHHSEMNQRQPHKTASIEALKYTADDSTFFQNRLRNIEQWWEHALVDEVDRLTGQLKQTLAESDDRKKQLSAAQEELKRLKDAEMNKGLRQVSKLEADKEQSSECKSQERKFRCLDRQATETNEEEDKLQTENDQLRAQNVELQDENFQLRERLDQTMKGAFEALENHNEADHAQDQLTTLPITRGRRLIRSGQVVPCFFSSLPSANFSLSLDGIGGLAFPSESIAPARQSARPQPAPERRGPLEPTGRDEYM